LGWQATNNPDQPGPPRPIGLWMDRDRLL